MKILVFAHKLGLSGTTVNAVELAAALRDDHGHDVVLFAAPGPLMKLAEEKRLRFIPAPDAQFHPCLGRMRALWNVVRRERPDLIHAWDWFQCVDSHAVAHLLRVPMLVTDMSMDLQRLLPKALPTTFGTPELVDQARAAGRKRVALLLPPVDIHRNAPGAVDGRSFRKQWGITDSEITLVTVSRLDAWLKGESLYRTLEAVRALGRHFPLRLFIVGEGSERALLTERAASINAELGRPAILLTGTLLDPRPAYAAADIVIGMGGSALRGMAFAKPVIIVGAQCFSAPLNSQTAASFLYRGMYGRGDASRDAGQLAANIRGLAENPRLLPALGEFCRRFVTQSFALETVSANLAQFCRAAASDVPRLGIGAADGLRTAAVWFREGRFLPPAMHQRIRATLTLSLSHRMEQGKGLGP